MGPQEGAPDMRRESAVKGGRARAQKLSPADRSAIAREAAMARWNEKDPLPRATHYGELSIRGRTIACAVLENKKRLLTQETVLKTIGRAGKAKAGTGSQLVLADGTEGLPPFLAAANLRPFISDELKGRMTPIVFRTKTGQRAYGYDAEILPMICEVYLEARDADALVGRQKEIADICDTLMRGLARVGIIALVDAATGYEAERAKDELNLILEKYIAPELMPWVKRFPDDFFKEIYRLHGWTYKPGSVKRPSYVGTLINKYVYGSLPPGVLDELKRLNPTNEKGYRRYKHHQFLTPDTGNVHLDRQIAVVLAFMRGADDKAEFEYLFKKAFKKQVQLELPGVLRIEEGD